jgi:hypothetical protein
MLYLSPHLRTVNSPRHLTPHHLTPDNSAAAEHNQIPRPALSNRLIIPAHYQTISHLNTALAARSLRRFKSTTALWHRFTSRHPSCVLWTQWPCTPQQMPPRSSTVINMIDPSARATALSVARRAADWCDALAGAGDENKNALRGKGSIERRKERNERA